jgi:ACS family glucarate transporter-like MFS transporter
VLLHSELDKQHSAFVQQIAPRLQAKLSTQARQALDDIASLKDGVEPTAEQKAALVLAVNDWIKLPDLYQGINLEPIQSKLNDQAKKLFNDPDTPSSVEKYTRLNRYLLELAFPGSIRQILGDGWQPVLAIYGAFGVLIAIVFFGFYRNSPREHFMTNQAEAELAEAHEIATESEEPVTPAKVLWKSMMTNISLWANSIVQFGTNFGWIFLGNNLAIYLYEVHEVPEGGTRGLMVSLPFLVSLPMMLVGGWWTDWMTRKYGRRMGRCFPIASTRFITGAAFVVCFFLRDPWAIVIVLCVMSIINDMGIPALWGYNLDVGRRNVGLVLGWGNMWGNLGAFVSPNVLFWLRDQFGDKKAGYDAIFLTCAGVFIFIGFVSLFIDATKSIGVEEPVK